MPEQAQATTEVEDPVELNGVLWKELQAIQPELTRDTAAPPPLEQIDESHRVACHVALREARTAEAH